MSLNTRCRLMLVIYLALLTASHANADWFNAEEKIMGTLVAVELWHEDPVIAEKAIAAVMKDMRRVEELMSPYKEQSELSQLNRSAARNPVPISAELFSLIEKSIRYSRLSQGAFDISFASVGRLYDFRRGISPAPDQLNDNLKAINYQLITANIADQSVLFGHPDLNIDLGGIAKGHAVDRGVAVLKTFGVTSALVSAGGDSRILGDRRGTPWVIGIRHPRIEDQYVVRIPLQNISVSTSGDYERFFIRGEERVHHIINPSTGKSAMRVQSVTILAEDAVDSDALSTTVFVLGIDKGLALVNQLSGVDAIIIDADGRLHYSEDLLRAGH
ncbi:MAG: FAD:protein FMN transferase [Oceanicoccus sp.]